MRPTKTLTLTSLIAALALAGCANGSNPSLLTTSSVAKPKPVKVAIDPACTTLAARISSIRQEGTPARVQAVAKGKTRTVSIKRASLAKIAELDRLNAEFQEKCSKIPGLQTAVATPVAAPAAPVAAQAARKPTVATRQPIVATPKR